MRISHLLTGTLLSTALLAAPAFAQAGGAPAETSEQNAPDQSPAFEGQTRAPTPQEPTEVTDEVIAEELPQLWAMEFLPDGRMLVTAKAGAMHIVGEDGTAGPEISGVPEVDARRQGGLLDVALAPDYETSGMIFFSFAEPREGGNGTSVASARLVPDDAGGGALEDVQVIFRQMPTYDGGNHFGSRLVFGSDDELYVTVGERSDVETRQQAQDIGSGLGKVFRIDREGNALPDNPFVDQEGAVPEIWSLGHRNMQSAALDGEGRLWTVEHGPRGGDELNRPEAGKNYGWPEVTYGIDYSGRPIGEGITQKAETEQPVYFWDPVIAPSGMAFYDGEEIPAWDNSFIIGGLVAGGLVVVHLEGDRVAFEERVSLEARVRDVKVGPDGAVYAVTENPQEGTSQIIRVSAAQ